MTRVAFFTSGEIGAGHVSHGLAIGRGLERASVDAEYRVLCTALGVNLPPQPSVTILPTATEELRDPDRAPASAVARALEEYRPDLLLVDLAWLDVRNLLPLPNCEAWLLLRWIPAQFLRGPLNRSFRPDTFARIIATEPIVPFQTPEQIEPVVICNPDECLPPRALRERFDVPDDARLTLVAQAGLPGECERLLEQESAHEDHVLVRASLDQPDPLFPLAPWLPGADRIVGGAGYNLYWEVRWLGLDERATLTPFPRRIDDQTPRVAHAADHRMRENGADQLARWIAGRAS